MRGAPHFDLRKYVKNQEYPILELFGNHGFPVSFDSNVYEGCKTKLEGLYPSRNQGFLLSISNQTPQDFFDSYCYISCFYGSSDLIRIVDFFTPGFKRMRNPKGCKSQQVKSLCDKLSRELREDVGIRRVDFIPTQNKDEYKISLVDPFTLKPLRNSLVMGESPQIVTIREKYLS